MNISTESTHADCQTVINRIRIMFIYPDYFAHALFITEVMCFAKFQLHQKFSNDNVVHCLTTHIRNDEKQDTNLTSTQICKKEYILGLKRLTI